MKTKAIIISAVIIALFFLGGQKALSCGEEHKEEFLQTYTLNPQGSFSLQNVNGLVVVSTWPEAKVEVKAVKRTKRDPKNLALVKIEVKSEGDRVTVETIYPRLRNTGVIVDYEIRLPEKLAETSLRSVNGRIKVTGPIIQLNATTVNGDLEVAGVEGGANLSAVNGQIEATLNAGPTKIETVNGSVTCQLLSLTENLSIETVNGAIKLRIAPEISLNAYLEARTTNGVISFDGPLAFQNLHQSRGRLEGQVGTGGPLIRLRTVNGGIHLTKG